MEQLFEETPYFFVYGSILRTLFLEPKYAAEYINPEKLCKAPHSIKRLCGSIYPFLSAVPNRRKGVEGGEGTIP